MLVLTRNPCESIRIGDNIEVTVLSVTGHSVRLGITAPREVKIVRDNAHRRDGPSDRERQDRDQPRAYPQ